MLFRYLFILLVLLPVKAFALIEVDITRGNLNPLPVAVSPLAIDKDGIDKNLVDKELEIIKEEITNSGKPAEIAEKISKGKISKFLNDNSLLNQIWIMDPKKKVIDILKEHSSDKEIKVLNFVKYKVGEGV